MRIVDKQQSLKSLAVTGSVWTLGGYGTIQLLGLGSHLVLAWLLAPQIFGLMALVRVVKHGLNMFSDVGIEPSIIQNKLGDDPAFLNTAWTIQIIRGFVLWICACILAFPFAALYARNDPEAWQLMYLLPVTGFVAVLQGFNSTALATLNRHMQLGRLTMLELATQVISFTVIIIWALFHPTVWAIVVGGLAGSFFKMVVSHFIVPGCSVRFQWVRECVGELVRFGRWIFLSTAFTFIARNFDKIVLGNMLTLAELGLYSMGSTFAMLGLEVSLRLCSMVLFPVYTKLQETPERLVSVALRARETVLWVGAALCVSFAVGAPLFFETLWDPRYHAAGGIAQWMTIYVWTMIVLMTMDRIPLALGNSRVLFFGNVLRCGGIIPSVGGYMIFGLPGFILGLAIGPIIAHVYVLRHVSTQRRAILMQGVRFTLGALAYSVPAVAMTMWVRMRGEWWFWAFTVFIFTGLPLLAAARAVWKGLRS